MRYPRKDAPDRPRPGLVRHLARLALRLAGVLLVGWAFLILLYRFVDPPLTPLMLLRLPESGRIDHESVAFSRISPELMRAVIAAEDNRFCVHHGIDWSAVGDAMEEYEADGRVRGASTITMQTARNLFLWPGGGLVRKGLEAPLALVIDALWPKRRIMAVYLNVIEWGNGIYGAEAAARHYFGVSARQLSRQQAALLAAVLPSPRKWSPSKPGPYVAGRAERIAARIDKLGGFLDCVR
jgi:monofunctional biosynthetic peptidoglycan transglycosylase